VERQDALRVDASPGGWFRLDGMVEPLSLRVVWRNQLMVPCGDQRQSST
jgi:hypothetical protein